MLPSSRTLLLCREDLPAVNRSSGASSLPSRVVPQAPLAWSGSGQDQAQVAFLSRPTPSQDQQQRLPTWHQQVYVLLSSIHSRMRSCACARLTCSGPHRTSVRAVGGPVQQLAAAPLLLQRVAVPVHLGAAHVPLRGRHCQPPGREGAPPPQARPGHGPGEPPPHQAQGEPQAGLVEGCAFSRRYCTGILPL